MKNKINIILIVVLLVSLFAPMISLARFYRTDFYDCYACQKNFENLRLDPQWLSIIILTLTLVVVAIYTHYTRRMANATIDMLNESLRPIVSCELKSGMRHYSEEEIKKNPDLKYDTRCIVRNWSKYNLNLFVNLNFKLNGASKEIHDGYAGKEAWPITSFQAIDGHFNFSKGTDLSLIETATIDLEVSYKSDMGKVYKNPVQHWRFDFGKGAWINNIGVVV